PRSLGGTHTALERRSASLPPAILYEVPMRRIGLAAVLTLSVTVSLSALKRSSRRRQTFTSTICDTPSRLGRFSGALHSKK
ncbi:MAG TPA: hypothetical protein VKD72_05370, partial [Gemmataceae bacterium]|nr:hypothetical protein [Gemmataceae bacterium]